ncbi:hypothetical protein ACQJBY_016484 [Aegilops geniculata]
MTPWHAVFMFTFDLFQVVGESGLFTPDHVSFVQDAGVKAILVGESLIKQEDPGKAIAGLFGKDISPVSSAV